MFFFQFIGSAGRREEESAEEAQFYDTVIGPVVEKMASHIKGVWCKMYFQ